MHAVTHGQEEEQKFQEQRQVFVSRFHEGIVKTIENKRHDGSVYHTAVDDDRLHRGGNKGRVTLVMLIGRSSKTVAG